MTAIGLADTVTNITQFVQTWRELGREAAVKVDWVSGIDPVAETVYLGDVTSGDCI